MRPTILALMLTMAGCGSPTPTPITTQTVWPVSEETFVAANKAHHEKQPLEERQKQEAETALSEQLEKDPQPLYDFAVKTLKKLYPEGHKLTITVDKSFVTMGPGMWMVRAHAPLKGADGQESETTYVGITAAGYVSADASHLCCFSVIWKNGLGELANKGSQLSFS